MECLFQKEKEEDKKNWLEERRNIRKYDARLNAIWMNWRITTIMKITRNDVNCCLRIVKIFKS